MQIKIHYLNCWGFFRGNEKGRNFCDFFNRAMVATRSCRRDIYCMAMKQNIRGSHRIDCSKTRPKIEKNATLKGV